MRRALIMIAICSTSALIASEYLYTPAFSIRTLINENRLNRSVNAKGELDLSHLHIADLDGIDEIPNISSVRTLNLSHNELSFLSRDSFKAFKSLRNLDLSFNHIGSLRYENFNNLIHLHKLNLSHNRLKNLNQHTFSKLTRLHKLNLSHNILEWIGARTFHNVSNLKILNLAGNRLMLISELVLDPLTQLRRLNISNNKFSFIHKHALHALHDLEDLDIRCNTLRGITDFTLQGLQNLKVLNLSHNKLTHVDIRMPEKFPNLRMIILDDNPTLKDARVSRLRKYLPGVKILKTDAQPCSKKRSHTKAVKQKERSTRTRPKPPHTAHGRYARAPIPAS